MDKQRQEPTRTTDETIEKRESIEPPLLSQQDFSGSGNLHATLAISELEARGGTSRSIRLPGGRQTSVVVPAGAYEGQVFSLEGLGEPAFPGGPRGTLTLTITIIPAKEIANGHLLMRVKSASQHFPRFFRSRALLLIGLLLLLALGVIGSVKLLSLRQSPSGATATHMPLATATPTPRITYPPPTVVPPHNGLYIPGTYNGAIFHHTSQHPTHISFFPFQTHVNHPSLGNETSTSP